jgi:hypothetical protein
VVAEPDEVLDVDRDHGADAVHEHRRHDVGVMDLLARALEI